MKIKHSLLIFFSVILFVFGTGHFLDKGKMMIPEFTVPYFSGAALIDQGQGWKFNLNEVDTLHKFISIPDKEESLKKINSYHFVSHQIDSRNYAINQPGYLYVVWIAGNIFRWTGSIGAVKLFQLLIHSVISLIILLLLKTRREQLIFFCLYVINPLIIYYALYPFYYFWEIIPSAILVYWFLSQRKISFLVLLMLALLLAFTFHIRSTVLVLSILVLLYAGRNLPIYKRGIVVAVFIFSLISLGSEKTDKHPGHIMYTSLGAYPNSYVKGFSDTISWNAYRDIAGSEFSYDSKPGMYDSEVFFGESKWCMGEYLRILKAEPLMVLRNAVLNFFQSFSLGHFRASLPLSYFSSLLGLILFLLLFLRKKFFFLAAIIAASCTYSFYLPPLPIYMYGSYLIILMALMNIFFGTGNPKGLVEKSIAIR
ncbi:MAG TPA: hypothetical protein PKM97_02575 [Bacteroidia bacterium]|nr:hypothetical protein [Bacteroidia bacterium]